MRRFDLSHLTDLTVLSAALAVALGIASLVAALGHIASDLHGFLDSAWIVSTILAVSKGGIRKMARVLAAAVGEQLRTEIGKGGERVRRCS